MPNSFQRLSFKRRNVTQSPLRIVLLGDFQRDEMRTVPAEIALLAHDAEVRHVADIAALSETLSAQAWYPDLIAVALNWPDEFPPAEVEQMFGLLPVARWICCCGVWCESDGRNRNIWPTGVRIPARAAAARIAREITVLADDKQALPLTASRDEAYLFDHHDSWNPLAKPISVLVHSRDWELQTMLCDGLGSAGFAVTRDTQASKGPSPPECAVWDIDPWNNETAHALRAFCSTHPHTHTIALSSMAHPRQLAAASECGVDAVLPKLATLTGLIAALQTDATNAHRTMRV
jgi:hypothetical protein